jgi:hypothetical protein
MRKGLLTILLVFGCLTFMNAQAVRNGSQPMVPSGKGFPVPGNGGPIKDSVHTGNQIDYHGGPIMPGTPNVYLIWYGKWNGGPLPSDSLTTVNLIRDFVTGISGSGYEMINSTYGDNNADVTGLVHLAGQIALLTAPLGKNLSDAQIKQIVSKSIASGRLPSDENGVYFVLTTSDVTATSGFCTVYCGWHTNASIGGKNIKYSFIGNPDRCPTGCTAEPGPNGDRGADGMASILAHELEEAISDPQVGGFGPGPYAWYQNASGGENADLCAWKFGTLLGGTQGVDGYNETFGGHNWYIQMNWENARGGGCDNFLGGPFHTK